MSRVGPPLSTARQGSAYQTWWKSLLRAPALHFVLGGLALFFLDRLWSGWAGPPSRDQARAPVVISAARIAALREEHVRQLGAPAKPAQEKALIEREIDDELLYREALSLDLGRDDPSIRYWLTNKMRFVSDDTEQNDDDLYAQALALGLDREDIVVRRILAQKMRLVAELSAGRIEPDEGEIAAYFESNRQDWTRPAELSFRHVFLSRDRHGNKLSTEAEQVLASLRAGRDGPDAGKDLGDPFPLGREYRGRSEEQLERIFGGDFARGVAALAPGSWQGPIPSAYGLHLVYVQEKRGAEPASLDSVRNQVSRRLVAERRQAQLDKVLEKLRDRYEIRIEEAPTGAEGLP